MLAAASNDRRDMTLEDDAIAVGSTVEGPAIIDAGDTTVYLPRATSGTRDEHIVGLLVLSDGAVDRS